MGILLAGPTDPARGDSGTVHTLSGAGLRMKIDTRWVDGGGYRPVRIDVIPSLPLADRTLTVEFAFNRYWAGNRRTDRVAQDIVVPAGVGLVRTTLSVPQVAGWDTYDFTVIEDGKVVRPLSSRSGGSSYGSAWAEAFPKILVVDNKLPDTAEIAALFSTTGYYQYFPQNQSASQRATLPTAIARAPSELPERWIDYTSLDVVCLSVKQLDTLARQRPRAFRAIVEWTAAGGNLLVFGIGSNWQRLGELESLVGLEPGRPSAEADPAARGWSLPDKGLFGKQLRGFGNANGNVDMVQPYTYSAAVRTPDDDAEAKPGRPSKPPKRPPFVDREFQEGMIVAMADGDPFPGTKQEWGWLLGTLGSERLLWYQRHGVSTVRPNPDFWKFLIPGVGLAPVGGFRVLITLFVVIIGPLNYFLLRRLKRLQLLLLTTPLAAAVVTLLLFGYAVVADGLGTRVRVRSMTRIDQCRGHAVSWARLSYYSGLSPAGGLRFPGDVAVTPLEATPMESRGRQRETVWQPDQRLVSGWLPPRTPTQLLTVRSRPAKIGLTITPTEGLRIENRLATPIDQLVVRSKDGKYWWAARLADGATVQAVPVDAAVALDRLEQVQRQVAPDYPPGMDRQGPASFVGLGGFRSYARWMYSQTGAPDPAQATSRLEQAIAVLRARRFRQGAALEPGSYLAIVRHSPEVVLGTESAREEAGFHLVWGTW